MKKRILTLFLAVMMVLSLLSVNIMADNSHCYVSPVFQIADQIRYLLFGDKRYTPDARYISAPTDRVYDGTPKLATLNNIYIINPTIDYLYKETANDRYAPASNTVDAGYYIAFFELPWHWYGYIEYQITTRDVTLTSASASKTYDGEPLTANEVTVTAGGFAGNESFKATANGSQTTAGTSANTFTYTLTNGAKAQNYNITTVNGTLTVNPANTLTVSAEDYTGVYDKVSHSVTAVPNITDGTTVSYSVNNGTSWSTTPPTITDAGEIDVLVKAENANYVTANCSYKLTVNKATPTVETVSATAITYGDTLAESTLTGTAAYAGETVPGIFTWEDGTIAPKVSDSNKTKYGVVFTPADTKNYNTVECKSKLTLTVNKADPVITEQTLPTASAITYGQTLKDSTLSGGNGGVPGTFTWKDKTIAPKVSDSNTTEYDVVFTPADTTNYNTADCKVKLTVNKADPDYDIPTGLYAAVGETLGDIELPTGFTWDEDTNTGFNAEGKKTFHVTYTPTDTDNYNILSGIAVTVTVYAKNEKPTAFTITVKDTQNGTVTASKTTAYAAETIKITVKANDGYTLKSLLIKNAYGRKVTPVRVPSDTEYTFIMPAADVTVTAVFEERCPQDKTCVCAKYTDLDTKAWYHDGVHYCIENGLMKGTSATEFAPEKNLSRAMVVTILWRMENSVVTDNVLTFKDVATDAWYTEAIRWAQKTGIVLGYSKTQFGPNDDVTREQLAAILMRYAEYKGIKTNVQAELPKFVDADSISTWALENVKWASAFGILNARTDITLIMNGAATRAETACMIQRFCKNVIELNG